MTRLDIISDVICPWCYIGKARLEQALANRPDNDFVIEWHPYMLNPDMPAAGMDRREYLELKFGGKKGAVEVYSSILDAAEAAGLEVRFDLIERTPSTVDAHRLIHWGGLQGLQTPVVNALFAAYFREGRDISDHAVLADIAAAAGLDRDVITKQLAGDSDRDDIRKRARNAAEKGVRGVPCFIIDNHYVVQGAQAPDLWEKVIDDIATHASAKPA